MNATLDKPRTLVFAIPGETNIIDTINPANGRSHCRGETLEQIKVRFPSARIMDLCQVVEIKIAKQNTPLVWNVSTEADYDEMMNVLPPECFLGGAFLVGEPLDHCAKTGMPRYEAHLHWWGNYYVSSRAMTTVEFRSQSAAQWPGASR